MDVTHTLGIRVDANGAVQNLSRFSAANDKATLSASKLQGGLRALATNIIGLNPQVSQLSTVIGSFALGSGIMAGALAGLAALGFAYNKLTEDSRAAKKAADELTKSLLDQQQAAFDATIAGQQAREAAALLNEIQAQNRLSEVREGARSRDPAHRLRALLALPAAERAAADAANASIQAVVNTQNAKAEAEKKAEAARKRAAAEAKRDEDAALARLREQVSLLSKIAIDFGGVQGGIDAIGQGPIRMPWEPQVGPVYGPGGESGEQIEARARAALNADLERSRAILAKDQDTADKNFSSRLEKLGTAAQIAAQTIEYALVQKLGGGTFSGNLGASVGKAALQQSAGGFAATALGQSVFGPLAAGAGAALGKGFDAFISDVFGSDAAREKARKAMQDAIDDFSRSLASERASIAGNRLEESILDVQQEYAERKRRAEELHGVGGVFGNRDVERAQEEARAKVLAELNRLEAERIQQLKEEDAYRRQSASEDLEVRALRAQGRDKEADAMARDLAQEREIREAEKDLMGEAIIKRLREIHALEDTAEALEKLTTSIRNAPSGFYLERYIRGTIGGSAPGGTWTPPPTNLPSPVPRPPMGGNMSYNFTGAHITIDAKDKTPRQAFVEWSKQFRQLRTSTVGLNAEPSLALTFLPE